MITIIVPMAVCLKKGTQPTTEILPITKAQAVKKVSSSYPTYKCQPTPYWPINTSFLVLPRKPLIAPWFNELWLKINIEKCSQPGYSIFRLGSTEQAWVTFLQLQIPSSSTISPASYLCQLTPRLQTSVLQLSHKKRPSSMQNVHYPKEPNAF